MWRPPVERPGSYIWYDPRWAQAATAPSDLARDRGETLDLAHIHSAKLAEQLALWDAYVEENGVLEDAISIFDADPARFETGWAPDPRSRAEAR